MLRKLLVPMCAGLIAIGTAASSSAQSPNNKSVFFTFSQPVTLPQVTLPAGRYMFELAGSNVNRNIVLVYSGDRSKLLATLMTISNQRVDPPNDAEVRFMETDANTPRAVRSWWYPGERTGWEFIYPREQALKLAKNAQQPVLTTARDTTSDGMKTADLARVDRSGQQTGFSDNGAGAAVAGDAERGEVGPSTSTAIAGNSAADSRARSTAMDTTTNRAPARTRLPRTASSMPAIAVMGFVALLAAAVLALRRRHLAN